MKSKVLDCSRSRGNDLSLGQGKAVDMALPVVFILLDCQMCLLCNCLYPKCWHNQICENAVHGLLHQLGATCVFGGEGRRIRELAPERHLSLCSVAFFLPSILLLRLHHIAKCPGNAGEVLRGLEPCLS